MITDIFERRYEGVLWYSDHATHRLQPLFMQAAHLVFADLQQALQPTDVLYKTVHDRLARELGLPFLPVQGENHFQRCAAFLAQQYDLWNNHHGNPDTFTKRRFSILEMLFSALEDHARGTAAPVGGEGTNRSLFPWSGERKDPAPANSGGRQAFAKAVAELNGRLQQHQTGLAYHNGMIQRSTDHVVEDRVVTPFWELVGGRGWSTVDQDMKEACDRADRLEPEAANYAMRALESALKLVSDDAGASTGKERGAGAYIDNLLSARSAHILRRWEGDALKALFRDIRNPMSHGGGASAPEPLTPAQTTWVIESCMSWIKSLAGRA